MKPKDEKSKEWAELGNQISVQGSSRSLPEAMEDHKIKGLRTINGAEEGASMVRTPFLRDTQLATEISTKANSKRSKMDPGKCRERGGKEQSQQRQKMTIIKYYRNIVGWFDSENRGGRASVRCSKATMKREDGEENHAPATSSASGTAMERGCEFSGFRIRRVTRILQTWRRASEIRRVLYEQRQMEEGEVKQWEDGMAVMKRKDCRSKGKQCPIEMGKGNEEVALLLLHEFFTHRPLSLVRVICGRRATVDGLPSLEYHLDPFEDNLDAKRALVGRIAEIVYSAVDEQTRAREGPGCTKRRVVGAMLSFGQCSEGQNARDACRERQTKVERGEARMSLES
ncbi:hypothetical protein B0H19DRAFT_1085846 [Mycena capillaripes]|nr:hypothetical protein B0H19DRAFT_1085846 [Mycena capillaripes]